MRHPRPVVRVLLALFMLLPLAAAAATLPSHLFNDMHWRQVGPFRGGRVLAVAGVPGHPNTYYFGTAGGGVWKTTDGGLAWRPILDRGAVASIGALAVAPSDPNVIYVGTGEDAPREDIGFGDGVYKSTDGGNTWTHIGLADTRHIGAIVVDPDDPNVVLVAALGHVYGRNTQRGVFRTTDGGRTWHKVLYENDRTGAIDLAMDPSNPRIIYAALWQMYRTPWHLDSGGPGSGLYKSTDAGKTWTRLGGPGFPTGVLGRIGVAVAGGSHGQRIYALIEAHKGGLYRSDDAGKTWQLVNDDQRFLQRAWYFMDVTADPQNPDRVYIGNMNLFVSNDAGRWFGSIEEPHGDNHALWINPTDPERLIAGEDGGAAVTTNGGRSWTQPDGQPTAQLYHIGVDNDFPYHLYSAQQDWGTVAIANASDLGGLTERDWRPVGGGESGYVLPSPADPHIVYAGSYFGILTRYDTRTGQTRDVSPWPLDTDGLPAKGLRHRFTWTAPLAFSPQNPKVLYTASQVLMKTTDGGSSWQQISPDLTRDDASRQGSSGGPITRDNASAEYYDLIYSIAPSPRASGQIWIGTDDGRVQLTRDGGKTWHNVTPRGLPEWAKVAQIEASPFDAGTAYVAVDAHKLDDLTPYIFRTRDYGRSWTRITGGLKTPAYVHVVREDPHHRGLLFAGTEAGVYVSFNDGGQWQPLQLNLPAASVRDLAVHAGDLIAATHGRGFWVLDDIMPLEQAAAVARRAPAHLYRPAPAHRVRATHNEMVSGAPHGQNPPRGAIIDYWLGPKSKNRPVTLTIRNARGEIVRRFCNRPYQDKNLNTDHSVWLPDAPGMHRIVWNLRYSLPAPIPNAIYDEGPPVGPMVLPGEYRLELQAGGKRYSAPLTVALDPRVHLPMADLQAHFDLMMKLRTDIAADHRAANQIIDVRKQLRALDKRLADVPGKRGVVAAAEKLDARLGEIEDMLWQRRAQAAEAMLNYPIALNSQLAYLQQVLNGADDAPSQQTWAVYTKLHQRLQTALGRWRAVREANLPGLNHTIRQSGLNAVFVKPIRKLYR